MLGLIFRSYQFSVLNHLVFIMNICATFQSLAHNMDIFLVVLTIMTKSLLVLVIYVNVVQR